MGKKNSFLLYLSSGPMVEALPDAEAGQLFKTLFRYGEDQRPPENLSPLAFVAFQAVRPYLDENREKWEHTCAARAEAGRAGGIASGKSRAKQVQANEANASKLKQNEANEADTEFESEFESEFVSESEYDSVPLLNEGNKGAAAPAPKKPKGKRFTPPTIEEVTAYCQDRGNGIDPSAFIDYYEARGWKIGNQAMKSWQAAVRTWERRSNDNGRSSAQIAPTSYTPADHIFD